MCGIAAILRIQEAGSVVESLSLKQQLDTLLEQMLHRGPDGVGRWTDEREIALGMNRLAIVGGESGMQPIFNEYGSVALVCNGEIYNHRELRKQLEASGHVFATDSDVEVIVHLYEAYGDALLHHIDGIFAFVLWDAEQRQVFAARDRLGVKPLYYTVKNGCIVFASELRALIHCVWPNQPFSDDGEPALNPQSFYAYNTFRYVPAPQTMVQGIQKMAAGQYLAIREGRMRTERYWQAPARERRAYPLRQKRAELASRMTKAIESQLTSDVPSGILLSGGLDSTLLLAISARLMGCAPATYTVSFEQPRELVHEDEYSEIHHAASAAKVYGSPHTFACFSAQEVLDVLPDIIRSVDEPIADPTAIPLWFASRLARQSGVKVLYSGEGLDELFNGYSVYFNTMWTRAAKCIPPPVRRMTEPFLARHGIPGSGVLKRSLHPVWAWYQGVGGVFTEAELTSLLQESDLPKYAVAHAREHIRGFVEPCKDESVLQQMTRFDVGSWLPENTLSKSDKVTMAHSIELRVPFLDHRLVEFALGLDERDKLRGRVGKWIIRQVAREFVPPSTMSRRKAGFPVPVTAWIFGEWQDYVRSALFDPGSFCRSVYRMDKVEELFHHRDRNRAGRMLWTLLAFELWHQRVFDAQRAANLRVPMVL